MPYVSHKHATCLAPAACMLAILSMTTAAAYECQGLGCCTAVCQGDEPCRQLPSGDLVFTWWPHPSCANLVSANYDPEIPCSEALEAHEPCGLDNSFACGLGLACVAESITSALCEPVCAPGFSDDLLYTDAVAGGCTIDTTAAAAATAAPSSKSNGETILTQGNVAVPACLLGRNLAIDAKPVRYTNVAQRAAAQEQVLTMDSDFEMDLKASHDQSIHGAADTSPDGSEQLARNQLAAQLIGLNLLFFEVCLPVWCMQLHGSHAIAAQANTRCNACSDCPVCRLQFWHWEEGRTGCRHSAQGASRLMAMQHLVLFGHGSGRPSRRCAPHT